MYFDLDYYISFLSGMSIFIFFQKKINFLVVLFDNIL